jgi:hypothetical protein
MGFLFRVFFPYGDDFGYGGFVSWLPGGLAGFAGVVLWVIDGDR